MDIRTKEAVRYLGYGRHAIDDRTFEMIQDSFRELENSSDARFVYRIFEISRRKQDCLKIGTMPIKSQNLYKNLKDCNRAILFAATLGLQVDRAIKTYTVTDVSRAVVMQACAAAMLEEFCDLKVEEISCELREGLYLRPRYSPGYGDFPITHQREILEMLEASKRIGLTLTQANMLVPMKSVTAVVGISEKNESCHKRGCELCAKTECIYRRS